MQTGIVETLTQQFYGLTSKVKIYVFESYTVVRNCPNEVGRTRKRPGVRIEARYMRKLVEDTILERTASAVGLASDTLICRLIVCNSTKVWNLTL